MFLPPVPRHSGPLLRWLIPLALLIAPGAHGYNWFYTVRPGDNLWTISETYLVSMDYWQPLGRLNRIVDPLRIPPGTRLQIPLPWLKIRPLSAHAVAAAGTVWVESATGQRRSVQPGMALNAGDRLSTESDGSLTLRFADDSTLLLQKNSILVLDSLSAYGDTGMVDTRLRLQQGRANHQVVPAPGGASYEIGTPVASSAVRGTEFRTAADPVDGITRTEVLDGRVALSGAARTVILDAHEGSLVRPGKAPTAPVRLLPPPDLGSIPTVLEQSPVPLQLPSLRGAVSYRVQIAPDAGFQQLLYDAVVATPRFRGPDLADGNYVLRMCGIDARGLDGLCAEHPIRVNARPAPPALLAPPADAMVMEERPGFAWAELSGVRGYSFRLAAAAAPDRDLYRRDDLADAALDLDLALPPGDYVWRVAATDSEGLGPFGDPQPFRRPRPTPNLDPPTVDDESLTLRWPAGLPGERYRVQFTADWTFEEILLDRVVDTPSITLKRPPSGIYYLRFQLIDPDGRASPPGPPQRIVAPPQSYLPLLLLPLLLLLP